MKQRFSSLDVAVIAHELSNKLVSLRIANIYDLSSKIFMVKLAKPNHKEQLVIDSGFRCHITAFSRVTASTPSDFVTKLRKHLKSRRVTAIHQVGTDRILEIQFSDKYRLFLEFFAGGNIILTDHDLRILTLLRVVEAGDNQEELRIGLLYSIENRQNFNGIPPLTSQRLRAALEKHAQHAEVDAQNSRKSKKNGSDVLRKVLSVTITECPPILIDHAMRVTSFDSTLKPADILSNEGQFEHLLTALQECKRVIKEVTTAPSIEGFIIAKSKNATPKTSDKQSLLYDDFQPFKPRQFEDDPTCVFLPFDGFNKTVDEFFSSIEGQRLESKLQDREIAAQRKLIAARQDQAKRLGGLQEMQELNERKASAIEVNVERVQEAMDAVNGLIAQQMDWVEISKLIELEQKRGNPVAKTIKLPLKLHENTITLLLNEESFDDEDDSAYESESDSDTSASEDERTTKGPVKAAIDSRLAIDINLANTPWANAREYYDQRRSAVEKEQKTLQSSNKALKSTEQKIAHDLKKGLKQEKAVLRPVRRQNWWEKFTWFISSDGYLVLGGRDAQQNEILYKKYLRKGDVYVHADLHGAGTIVIRNSHPDSPIPPSTLSQAGTLAVASSSAWDSKAGMSAWWVNADQVSKLAPSGDFLPVGNFAVKGNKNFLPPAVLLLGFGVMFQVSDESKTKHLKHRVQEDMPKPIQQDEANDTVDDGTDESEDEDDNSAPTNPLQSTQELHRAPENEELPLTKPMEDLDIDAQADQDDSDADDGAEDIDSDTSNPTEELTAPQASQHQTKKGPTPLPRGKRTKAKKIASKYRDQDEEDRLAAAALIGSTAGQQKAEAEAAAKAAKEAELAFQKERRRAQHQKTQEEMRKTEEARKAMLEATEDTTLDEDEVESLALLDGFVGTPLPGDEILDAIPVCAPWAALGMFKYKAKLQPGAQKKGKAVKEVIDRWVKAEGIKGALDHNSQDKERIWPREMELLKAWKPEECINVVPVSKVRVMMAGSNAGGPNKDNKGKAKGGKGGKKR